MNTHAYLKCTEMSLLNVFLIQYIRSIKACLAENSYKKQFLAISKIPQFIHRFMLLVQRENKRPVKKKRGGGQDQIA